MRAKASEGDRFGSLFKMSGGGLGTGEIVRARQRMEENSSDGLAGLLN